jgi:hypothetical protein
MLPILTYTEVQYSHDIVETIKALKITFDLKHKPVSWLPMFCDMDDLCLSIRMFREYYMTHEDKEEWEETFHKKLEETESCVIDELTVILNCEVQKGIKNGALCHIASSTSKALSLSPIAEKHHLLFGILDLIQQHVQAIKNPKLTKNISEVALLVAEGTKYSYLRCKAFELLAAMRPNLEGLPDNQVRNMLQNWEPDIKNSGLSQWEAIQRRVEDMQDRYNCWSGECQERQESKIVRYKENSVSGR